MVADQTTALARAQEAVPLARASGDPGAMWFAISILGHTFRHVDPALTEAYIREADEIARAAEYPAALADPWILGECRRALGDLETARALFSECLSASSARDAPFTAAFAHRGLGQLDWMAGLWADAEEHLLEALRLHSSMRFARGIADLLEALAWNAASAQQPERAAQCLGAAESVRSSLGIGIQAGYRVAHEAATATAVRQLGADGFETLFTAAKHWSGQQATSWALAPSLSASPKVADSRDPLTLREREVARLLAQGYTNRQIAEALTIAERTAETHVSNILTKLELASRVEVRAWAVDHGLIVGLSAKDT
jgi:non-specific serine/threonine protein kinase